MSTPVLLLDAAWRIDRIIGIEHACELLATQRATPASERIAATYRSPSIRIDIPEVVARLHGTVRHTWQLPACTPRRVRLRDRHQCQFVIGGEPCGRRGGSVDHLQPKSRGGPDDWANLVASCTFHNNLKADRTLDETGWDLRRQPRIPSRDEMLVVSIRNPPDGWIPFLPKPVDG